MFDTSDNNAEIVAYNFTHCSTSVGFSSLVFDRRPEGKLWSRIIGCVRTMRENGLTKVEIRLDDLILCVNFADLKRRLKGILKFENKINLLTANVVSNLNFLVAGGEISANTDRVIPHNPKKVKLRLVVEKYKHYYTPYVQSVGVTKPHIVRGIDLFYPSTSIPDVDLYLYYAHTYLHDFSDKAIQESAEIDAQDFDKKKKSEQLQAEMDVASTLRRILKVNLPA